MDMDHLRVILGLQLVEWEDLWDHDTWVMVRHQEALSMADFVVVDEETLMVDHGDLLVAVFVDVVDHRR